MKRKHPYISVSFNMDIKLKNSMTIEECQKRMEEIKAEFLEKYGEGFCFELCNTATCKQK